MRTTVTVPRVSGSEITSALCARCWPVLEPRPSSFREVSRSIFDVRSAGARPNRMPARPETPSAKKRTGRLSPGLGVCSKFGGSANMTTRALDNAISSPAAPPVNESSTLSVTSWRTIHPRLALSAARTAIPAARRRSRQQQVRHVRASDQQDHTDRRHQQQKHRANVAHKLLLKGRHHDPLPPPRRAP